MQIQHDAKKTYETPVAEKVEFCYSDQVVASAGSYVTGTGADDHSSGDNCPIARIFQGFGAGICDYLPFNLE